MWHMASQCLNQGLNLHPLTIELPEKSPKNIQFKYNSFNFSFTSWPDCIHDPNLFILPAGHRIHQANVYTVGLYFLQYELCISLIFFPQCLFSASQSIKFFFLLEYNCFIMLCQFLLYSEVDQLCVSVCPLPRASQTSLHPTMPSHPSGSSQTTKQDLLCFIVGSHQLSVLTRGSVCVCIYMCTHTYIYISLNLPEKTII